MVHHKKPDRIANPGPLLGELWRCREVMIASASNRYMFYHGP